MCKKAMWVLSAVLMAVGVAGVWGCSKKGSQEFLVGAVLPLTGPLAEFGQDERRGMELAKEDFRALLPSEIRIVYADSKSDPKNAVSALKSLLVRHRLSAIYTLGSSISLALAPIALKEKIPMIAVAATPDLLREGGKGLIYRNYPSAEYLAGALAEYAYGVLGLREVGILHINDDLGLGSAKAFRQRFEQLGGKILFQEPFGREEKDFRSLVQKVKSRNPQALYVPGYGESVGLLVRQLREMGFSEKILGSQEFGYPRVLEVAGEAAEGVMFSDVPYDPEDTSQAIRRFVKKFTDRYGKSPTFDALLGYEGVELLVHAARAGNGVRPRNISEGLQKIGTIKSIFGVLRVSPDGEILFPVVIKQIQNGRPVIVYRREKE